MNLPFVKDDVEPDMWIIASPDGPVVAAGARYATRGELPYLARPEGCYAATRGPLRGKAGEPVSAPTGRIGR